MIKVAVVGMGFMGKTHIGIYQRLDNVELSAICDANADRLNIASLESGGECSHRNCTNASEGRS